MIARKTLSILALIFFLSSCASTPVSPEKRDEERGVYWEKKGGNFASPIYFNSVEFTIEVDSVGSEGSVRIVPERGVILLRGEPIVRTLRYAIFEIDGRRYHFPRGAKVFIFAPRPDGRCRIHFKELPVILSGRPGRRFVASIRMTPEGEILGYGETKIRFLKGRYFGPDGRELPAEALRKGVTVTRRGEIKVGGNQGS